MVAKRHGNIAHQHARCQHQSLPLKWIISLQIGQQDTATKKKDFPIKRKNEASDNTRVNVFEKHDNPIQETTFWRTWKSEGWTSVASQPRFARPCQTGRCIRLTRTMHWIENDASCSPAWNRKRQLLHSLAKDTHQNQKSHCFSSSRFFCQPHAELRFFVNPTMHFCSPLWSFPRDVVTVKEVLDQRLTLIWRSQVVQIVENYSLLPAFDDISENNAYVRI